MAGTGPEAKEVRCAAALAAFGLLIANWRSPVGVRSSSSNFDLLAFSAATVLIPICLLWAARSLSPISARRRTPD